MRTPWLSMALRCQVAEIMTGHPDSDGHYAAEYRAALTALRDVIEGRLTQAPQPGSPPPEKAT